ncbi:hypothetical protein bcere0005_30840 [Bacillus cereus 172560W]|nr:hypothetical protein bcere0005_30840 [Bacillus cereus 172560W]
MTYQYKNKKFSESTALKSKKFNHWHKGILYCLVEEGDLYI